MSSAFPISCPVQFVAGTNTVLEFNAREVDSSNVVQNFVTSATGDLMYAKNTQTLTRLPIGVAGSTLRTSMVTSLPYWQPFESLVATKSAQTTGYTGATFPFTGAIVTGWQVTSLAGEAVCHDSFSPSGAFNTTTGIFTAPATGTYFISADVQFSQTSNNGTVRENALVLAPSPGPGTIIYHGHFPTPTSNSASNQYNLPHLETIIELNQNDTVAVEARSNQSVGLFNIEPGSVFRVVRLK